MKIKQLLAAGVCAAMLCGVAVPYAIAQETAEETAQAEYAALFEKDSILKINIEIPEEDWQDMMDNAIDEAYHSATVTVGDYTLENVGVRTKGNSSLKSVASSDSDRYSLRIKFDKYVKDQNILGLDEMVVNNGYTDPSYMREYLTYEAIAEIGLDAPMTVFTEVSVNGEVYGFYLGIEAIDDSLLERLFGSSKGNLYKADQGSTLVYEEGSTYDTLVQKNGKDESREDIIGLIETLNAMPEGEKGDIESVLDVSSALKYIAVQTVLGNYDSYSGTMAQNYYLYQTDGVFSVIPWDYNMSFGGFAEGGSASSTTIPIDEPVMGVSMQSRPLINNLLAVEEYLEEYHGYVQTLTDWLENIEERANEIADIIRPYVESDPTAFYTAEEFEAQLVVSEVEAQESSFGGMGERSGADGQEIPALPENFTGEAPEGFDGNMPGGARGNGFGREQNGTERSGMLEVWEPGTEGAGDDWRGQMRGGMGGGMMQSAGSLVTYAVQRRENLKLQLSGELETTGNTTMQNGRGGMPGGMRQLPAQTAEN